MGVPFPVPGKERQRDPPEVVEVGIVSVKRGGTDARPHTAVSPESWGKDGPDGSEKDLGGLWSQEPLPGFVPTVLSLNA